MQLVIRLPSFGLTQCTFGQVNMTNRTIEAMGYTQKYVKSADMDTGLQHI